MTGDIGAEPPVMTAVILGVHLIEVPGFIRLFRSLPGVDAYPQSIEDWAADLAHVRDRYEVVIFYNINRTPPNDTVKAALESLGETRQGILMLHHGMLAFPEWQLWSDIVGIRNRSFTYHPGETVHVEIADPDHPITRGLAPWTMIDETYIMESAGEGSHILLTTRHPKSLSTLAWTRQYKRARVFCLASGHGTETYENTNFQTVLARGIHWLAHRI
jgi:type 1 glutamine amidotransferase